MIKGGDIMGGVIGPAEIAIIKKDKKKNKK